MPTPPRTELPWTYHWDRVLGQSTDRVAVLVLLTLLGAATAHPVVRAAPWSVRRDSRSSTRRRPDWGRCRPSTSAPKAVPENGLTATLFHLAERKLIELRAGWTSTPGTSPVPPEPGAWADIDPVSVAVGSALKVIGPGAEFKARKSATSGRSSRRPRSIWRGAVRKWAVDEGLMVKRTQGAVVARRQRGRGDPDGVRILPVGFPDHACGRCRSPRSSCSPALAWRDGVGSRRTAAGRELWSRAGGFHRLLATDSAETGSTSGPARTSTRRYVPFAVAAGTAALWAQKYRDADGAPLRRNRIGTTPPRRVRPRVSPEVPAGRSSTVSNRRCRRRSAPTPHRSPRRRAAAAAAAVAAAVVAVAEAAEEVEADHGEVLADSGAGDRGAGADPVWWWATTSSSRPTCGWPRRCRVSMSN